jgi:hypothetical protein
MKELLPGLIDAAAVVLLGGAVALFRMMFKQGKDIRLMREDWQGTPARPGVPAKQGVMERLESGDRRFDVIDGRMDGFETNLQHIADELPKNGMPVAEKIDRIYRALDLEAKD